MYDFIELPTGIDLEQYSGYEQWCSRRWAWEFLRRNVDFQKRCTSLDALTDKERLPVEKDIANLFGLKHFKDFREVYSEESRGKIPAFLRMSGWVSLKDGKSKSPKIKLIEGDVLIKFNLLAALNDKTVIGDQIKRVEEFLNVQLEAIAANKQKVLKPRRASNHKEGIQRQLYFLRLLDAKRSRKKSQQDIYKLLNKIDDLNLDRDQIIEKFKTDVSTAAEITKSRYINFALKHD